MPVFLGAMFGLRLGPWGVIGVVAWFLLPWIASKFAGEPGRLTMVLAMLGWALYHPAESDKKVGFIRALKLAAALTAIAGGVVTFIALAMFGPAGLLMPRMWPSMLYGAGGVAVYIALGAWIRRDGNRFMGDLEQKIAAADVELEQLAVEQVRQAKE